MKPINVLITCSNIHVKNMIDCLKNNYEGTQVNVYCVNSVEWDLPKEGECDGAFVVPKASDESYFPMLLELCKRLDIDVVFPVTSIDLDAMSEHKYEFEKHGIHISVTSPESMRIANDKIALHEMFGEYMPKQIIAKNVDEVIDFADSVNGSICCKVANMCGGRGFAVVDDEKCIDVSLFHRFGKKHYISTEQIYQIVDKNDHDVIVQEYKDGLDYSVSVLADKGRVTHICGYVGYVLEFGSMMYAEIKPNEQAYEIARTICEKLGIDGNACFDFILGEDCKVTLLEINPRVNASLNFVSNAGCNMFYLRCKQLLGYDYENDQQEINVGFKMKKYFETRYFI